MAFNNLFSLIAAEYFLTQTLSSYFEHGVTKVLSQIRHIPYVYMLSVTCLLCQYLRVPKIHNHRALLASVK